MGALGYVMHVPEEEKYLNSEAELRDMLVGLVGGRAAEEVVFDSVTTGAANDIERATEIARNMVTRFGMSKRFGLMGLASIEHQYLGGEAALTCSQQTAAAIDEEVMEIIKESYEKALSMLRENRELMDKLASYLIEKETITGKEFMKIFRAEKGLPEPEEEGSDGAGEGNDTAVITDAAPANQVTAQPALEASQAVPAQASEQATPAWGLQDTAQAATQAAAQGEAYAEGLQDTAQAASQPVPAQGEDASAAPEQNKQENRPKGLFSGGTF